MFTIEVDEIPHSLETEKDLFLANSDTKELLSTDYNNFSQCKNSTRTNSSKNEKHKPIHVVEETICDFSKSKYERTIFIFTAGGDSSRFITSLSGSDNKLRNCQSKATYPIAVDDSLELGTLGINLVKLYHCFVKASLINIEDGSTNSSGYNAHSLSSNIESDCETTRTHPVVIITCQHSTIDNIDSYLKHYNYFNIPRSWLVLLPQNDRVIFTEEDACILKPSQSDTKVFDFETAPDETGGPLVALKHLPSKRTLELSELLTVSSKIETNSDNKNILHEYPCNSVMGLILKLVPTLNQLLILPGTAWFNNKIINSLMNISETLQVIGCGFDSEDTKTYGRFSVNNHQAEIIEAHELVNKFSSDILGELGTMPCNSGIYRCSLDSASTYATRCINNDPNYLYISSPKSFGSRTIRKSGYAITDIVKTCAVNEVAIIKVDEQDIVPLKDFTSADKIRENIVNDIFFQSARKNQNNLTPFDFETLWYNINIYNTVGWKLALETIKPIVPEERCQVSPCLKYGTSGYRSQVKSLQLVVFRVAIAAMLLSKRYKGKPIGMMLTASHNPECDNGVKLVNQFGHMLLPEEEDFISGIVQRDSCLMEYIEKESKAISEDKDLGAIAYGVLPATIVIGCDTRTSSAILLKPVLQCLKALPKNTVKVVNIGFCTTPQLHYTVATLNMRGTHYYKTALSRGCLIPSLQTGRLLDRSKLKEPDEITIDCANGAGALLSNLQFGSYKNKINFINSIYYHVNEGCGSDFVLTRNSLPKNAEMNQFGCSLDGDADRCIFWKQGPEGLVIVGGDEQLALLAKAISKLISTEEFAGLTCGAAITAYTNSSCVDYLMSHNIVCRLAPTGVKWLHRAAEEFDFGLYMESNGHGSVVLSEKAIDAIREVTDEYVYYGIVNALKLVNPYIGDAYSQALLMPRLLKELDLDIETWSSLYTPKKFFLEAVCCENYSNLIVDPISCEVIEPLTIKEVLKNIIDHHSTSLGFAKAFARLSGTEPGVMRIYCEASGTQEEVDSFYKEVKKSFLENL